MTTEPILPESAQVRLIEAYAKQRGLDCRRGPFQHTRAGEVVHVSRAAAWKALRSRQWMRALAAWLASGKLGPLDYEELVAFQLHGRLPGGATGTLRVRCHADGSPENPDIALLGAVTGAIPESVAYIPTLFCHNEIAIDETAAQTFLGEAANVRRFKRVRFESEKLSKRFQLLVNPAQDEIWLRRLFSPTFIDWLAERAPDELAFSLDRGGLRVALFRRRLEATPEGWTGCASSTRRWPTASEARSRRASARER